MFSVLCVCVTCTSINKITKCSNCATVVWILPGIAKDHCQNDLTQQHVSIVKCLIKRMPKQQF